MLNNPKLWLFILFFYSLFSVYPQELLYRTFFFKRYQALFKSEWLFIIVNAALFSLAHIFFKNVLVILLTFIGGILFALTFKKTKSTLLVSIEHSIYGCWLFTVGMGNMLGFPS
ncbi:CPBP family intramembrane glutamic endopeptidase [Pseudocolwellia agarivorans]|uniref:CPBP family intramembrane glutamic endopeptidase n=1 Tax=Pseudocolwellia agarivorans TaxID=1911682 RepID=UPI001FE486C6|nr:CPBP family intramembrane glutamic endopeptidase [Pseudocolwellia agarivorans]